MSTRRPVTVTVPLLPVLVEAFGTLLLALGASILFAPDLLARMLPSALLTTAVGWTAVCVGLPVSMLGAWQLVGELRRRAATAAGRRW